MDGPILLLGAHPDDEALSLTALMHQEHRRILHVQATDGAPRNLRYAQAAGFATREEYAEARRREKLAALAAVSARCRNSGSTAASVKMKPSMVAMSGAIMPDPLITPTSVTVRPSTIARAVAPLGKVSVVPIPSAAACQPQG